MYSAGEITQEIIIRKTVIPNISIMESVEGSGHLLSLEKPYFKELKEYLERMKTEQWMQKTPVAFVSENPYVARQACAVWKKQLHMLKRQGEEETKDEDYDYGALTLEDEAPKEGVIGENEILIITKKALDRNKEMQEMQIAMMNQMGTNRAAERAAIDNLLARTETLLMEFIGIPYPDEAVEALLKAKVPQVAVSVCPKDSYKYFLKRLSFEGKYQVIHLGKPKIEDYCDYGSHFISYFEYKLENTTDMYQMVEDLAAYRGELMTEADVYQHLRSAFEMAQMRGENILRKEDITLKYYGMENPMEELESMIGLEKAKQILFRYMAAQKVMKGIDTYKHLIFAGNPGTGKSCMARIFASVMGKMGLSNGKFVDATRADLIGKYVGHTAAQMKVIFERADGGVLFIDEASFLLEDDKYVKEAVIELVRFMELYPQTTVIFATYPKEAEALLQLDSGLESRIYRTILFENYNNEQLWEIAKGMAKKYDFEIHEEGKAVVEAYMNGLRKNDNYGNAREIRKLLQTAMEEYGLAKKIGNILDVYCLRKAMKFLDKKKPKQNSFGFSFEIPTIMYCEEEMRDLGV